jgi:hypothetical protein
MDEGLVMSRADQARSAARAYSEGNALSKMNAARRIGAALDALKATDADKALLAPHYGKVPVSTLGDYHSNNETVGALIDRGLAPHLVNREALSFGMHPMIEVWDVGVELVKVGRGGRSFMRHHMVMTSTQHGDALLSPDTLLAWY